MVYLTSIGFFKAEFRVIYVNLIDYIIHSVGFIFFYSDYEYLLFFEVGVEIGIDGGDHPVFGLFGVSIFHIPIKIAQLKKRRHIG